MNGIKQKKTQPQSRAGLSGFDVRLNKACWNVTCH